MELIWSVWILMAVLVTILANWRWREWKASRKRTPSELFKAIEHDVAMMRTIVECEFLPLTEDLVATMTDLLREMEAEERRQR